MPLQAGDASHGSGYRLARSAHRGHAPGSGTALSGGWLQRAQAVGPDQDHLVISPATGLMGAGQRASLQLQGLC
jgi:hypothetical protein